MTSNQPCMKSHKLEGQLEPVLLFFNQLLRSERAEVHALRLFLPLVPPVKKDIHRVSQQCCQSEAE